MSSQETLQAGWVTSVRDALLGWYAHHGRDLPWRRDITPYRVLVSEMMLVQTTVAAVIPYFERFLARFPDPHSLAAANEDEVLKTWEGLGYYRRARQLHAAARMIVQEWGGEFPRDPAAIRTLPGVGDYVAGALLSFAFDQPAPILEANSERVLSRLVGLREDPRRATSRRRLWSAAAQLVPEHHAGDFNQALMDLGATTCTPRTPSCLICPLKELCKAKILGLQDTIPVRTARPAPLEVSEATALVMDEGALLLVQRAEGGLWPRFWEFPTVNLEGADPACRVREGHRVRLAAGIEDLTGIRVSPGPEVRTVVYSVTKHRVTLHVHTARRRGGELRVGPGFEAARWVKVADLASLTLTSPARKLAAWIGTDPERCARLSSP